MAKIRARYQSSAFPKADAKTVTSIARFANLPLVVANIKNTRPSPLMSRLERVKTLIYIYLSDSVGTIRLA